MGETVENVFLRIIRREIPAQIVFESESVLAFKDINPQAPVHIIVIPKKPIENLMEVTTDDQPLLGELLLVASKIAKEQRLEDSGYRIVINNGAGGGQTVFHLHLHILGGRAFDWPPG